MRKYVPFCQHPNKVFFALKSEERSKFQTFYVLMQPYIFFQVETVKNLRGHPKNSKNLDMYRVQVGSIALWPFMVRRCTQ